MLAICSFLSSCNKPAIADNCVLHSNTKTEKALVKWVYDGDTLLVTDRNKKNKRKIRIIGIDTPEVKHHQQKAEQYGAKAREALRELLKKHQYRVLLEYDKTQFDRYKRILAHVYLEDGTNISEWLLQQGFAKTLIIPPNVKHASCYQTTEAQAQNTNQKIWRLKHHKLTLISDLKEKRKGYIRLVTKVEKIDSTKKSLYLITEKTPNKKTIRIRIKKKHLSYFTSIHPTKLAGKTIIVTGVLKKKRGKRTMTLSHGAQLALLSSDVETIKKESRKTPVAPTIKWSL